MPDLHQTTRADSDESTIKAQRRKPTALAWLAWKKALMTTTADSRVNEAASAPQIPRTAATERPRPMLPFQVPRLVHRVPRRRVRIDGESQPPRAVQRLDGQPLIYILDDNTLATGELSIFTAPEHAVEATGFQSWTPGTADAPDAQGVTFGGYVSLYQHIYYQGYEWNFYPGWGPIPDFRHVYGWSNIDINDQVSSMDVNVNANPVGTIAWVVLYSDISFGGDQLWTSDSFAYDDQGGGMRANLVDIGWNDVASSLAYGYSVGAH
jgi:hypothetical protein